MNRRKRQWCVTYGCGANMSSDISGPYTWRVASRLAANLGAAVSHSSEVRQQFVLNNWAF